MINWMATNNNMTGSYCLSKKSHVSHHVIFITVCAQNVCLQHERKHVDADATFQQHIQSVWLTAAHSLLTCRFSSSTSEILVGPTIDLLLINVKEVTDFQWFSGLTIIFWAGMRYPAWIHCCKRPKYDFCISQGSVATVLRLGGQNYGRLCHVSSRCCVPKIIKFGQCFTELFTK